MCCFYRKIIPETRSREKLCPPSHSSNLFYFFFSTHAFYKIRYCLWFPGHYPSQPISRGHWQPQEDISECILLTQGVALGQWHMKPSSLCLCLTELCLLSSFLALHLPWTWQPRDDVPLASSETLTAHQVVSSGTHVQKESRVGLEFSMAWEGQTVLPQASSYGSPLAAKIARPQSPLGSNFFTSETPWPWVEIPGIHMQAFRSAVHLPNSGDKPVDAHDRWVKKVCIWLGLDVSSCDPFPVDTVFISFCMQKGSFHTF